jgi:hypothetical protein
MLEITLPVITLINLGSLAKPGSFFERLKLLAKSSPTVFDNAKALGPGLPDLRAKNLIGPAPDMKRVFMVSAQEPSRNYLTCLDSLELTLLATEL